MEHIIQRLALELAKTILEKSTSERIRDIGDLAESLLKDCKNTALEMLTVILEHLNDEIRQDKQGRKKEGLTLQQRQRSRTLLTSLGELTWERDYYRSKNEGTYRYLLDEVIGVYQTPQAYYVDDADVNEFDRMFPEKEKLKLPGQIFD